MPLHVRCPPILRQREARLIIKSFINAPHSRERLNITKEMFNFALTYHQVMVAFLDFVFPFGSQIEPHDNSSAFRSINHLSDLDKGFSLTELGRSGLSLQQAYNLKAVEPKDDSDWPWSIRQTAIYHSFDQANGRTIWIIIKGNSSMEKRMKAAQERLTPNGISKHQKTEDAFLLSLELHMVVCEWARENWRWFINFLDEKLHIATRGTATADVGSPKLVSTVRSPPTGKFDFKSESVALSYLTLAMISLACGDQWINAPPF